MKYDPITEQFIREEFHFDEEAFKKEGQEFMREKEKEDYAKKTAKAKHNWDQRVVHNDKIRDLCAELLHQDNQEETV